MSSSEARRRVTTKAVFKAEGEKCLDHLLVFRADREMAYLAPLMRLLVPRNMVSVLNCSHNFPLTFEDVNRRMVARNPAMVKVTVNLSDYYSGNYHSHNHTDLFLRSCHSCAPKRIPTTTSTAFKEAQLASGRGRA